MELLERRAVEEPEERLLNIVSPLEELVATLLNVRSSTALDVATLGRKVTELASSVLELNAVLGAHVPERMPTSGTRLAAYAVVQRQAVGSEMCYP